MAVQLVEKYFLVHGNNTNVVINNSCDIDSKVQSIQLPGKLIKAIAKKLLAK